MDAMTEMMFFWAVLVIAAIAIEAATMGLTSIWFAGGGLLALGVAALRGPIVLQIVLFFVVSLVLLIFTRPVAVKYFNKDRVKTNAESIVGRKGIVTGEIDNLKGTGQVTVAGQEWTARSQDPESTIETGVVVKILAIDGVKLIVEPEEAAKG